MSAVTEAPDAATRLQRAARAMTSNAELDDRIPVEDCFRAIRSITLEQELRHEEHVEGGFDRGTARRSDHGHGPAGGARAGIRRADRAVSVPVGHRVCMDGTTGADRRTRRSRREYLVRRALCGNASGGVEIVAIPAAALVAERGEVARIGAVRQRERGTANVLTR